MGSLRYQQSEQRRIYLYESARAAQLQQRVQRFLGDQRALNDLLTNHWAPICQLFSRGQNREGLELSLMRDGELYRSQRARGPLAADELAAHADDWARMLRDVGFKEQEA